MVSKTDNADRQEVTPLPGKLRFQARKAWKKQRIIQLMKDYDEFAKANKKDGARYFTDQERYDYEKQLTKLSHKELARIGRLETIKPAYSLMDKWHKLEQKSCIIARFYHKNNSSTDYAIAKHTRILEKGRFSYLFPPNAGVFDNKHKKIVYSYYDNNPFPIQFGDDFETTDAKGHTYPDAELLKKTLKFEYAQKLAASEMSKKVDLTFIFCIINLFISAATLLICLKGLDFI